MIDWTKPIEYKNSAGTIFPAEFIKTIKTISKYKHVISVFFTAGECIYILDDEGKACYDVYPSFTYGTLYNKKTKVKIFVITFKINKNDNELYSLVYDNSVPKTSYKYASNLNEAIEKTKRNYKSSPAVIIIDTHEYEIEV